MKCYTIFILGFLFAFSSCQSRPSGFSIGGNYEQASMAYDAEDTEIIAPPPSKPSVTPTSAKKLPEKLIKKANLTCEVADFEKSKQNILQSVKKWNGYISDEKQRNAHHRISNDITIRVVKESFDALLEELETHVFRIDERNLNTQDVSEQFFDIESRLRTKKAMEKRYLEILQKADKVEDILKVERELRLLREEIEAKEGKLNFLSDQVNYSTIHLKIYQSLQVAEQVYRRPSFFGKIIPAIKSGWYVLLDFIIGILYIWPFLLLGIFSAYLLRRFLMRKRKK